MGHVRHKILHCPGFSLGRVIFFSAAVTVHCLDQNENGVDDDFLLSCVYPKLETFFFSLSHALPSEEVQRRNWEGA